MEKIADYRGTLLNHIETLYSPGEREIAIRLAEALGCTVTDTGFTGGGDESFLAAHVNPADPDMQNNAFYMSPMPPEQQELENRLKQMSEDEASLGAMLRTYRETARTRPFGIPHFALRYGSSEAVRQVADSIVTSLGPLLGDRLHVRVFIPTDADAAVGNLAQGFIHQDVIVAGSFLYGQLIELQSQPVR